MSNVRSLVNKCAQPVMSSLGAAGIETGPVFRRVNVRRYKARAAVRGRHIDSISARETWDPRETIASS